MKRAARFRILTLLVGLSVVLTACGGAADTPTTVANTPTTAASGGTTGGTTPAATPAAGATATTGTAQSGGSSGGTSTNAPIPGVLRLNWGSQPDTIDPQQMSFVGEIGFGQLVFEGLMNLDENLKPVPGAAEKMDVSPDGLQYTLTLRDGLKYSDGTPLTAKNFDYAWHRLFDPRVPNRQYSFVAYDIAGAEELDTTPVTDTAKINDLMGKLGVKATDDKHIVFTLKNKAAYFPYILTLWTGWPSRQDLVEAGGDSWTTDPNGKYYIGNGPFVVKKYDENGFTLEANPNYRLGAPKLKEIRAVYISDTAVAFQSYKKGELDAVGLSAEDLATVKNDPVLSKEYQQVAGNCSFYLGFNTKKAPFDNVKVRQAFAQAFDRQDYVNSVLQGLGTVAQSFIPPGRPGYAKDINAWPFDAAAAKKTLADAGFPNGQGLPPIKLTYSSSPRNTQRMEWMQNQIKNNLGIDTTLDPVESKAYTALTKDPNTTPQLFLLGWCQDYPDPQDWLTLVFHSSSTVTHIGWKNDQFDSLVKQADVETDATKRADLYHQAQQILVQDAPAVFLYWDTTNWMIKPYVQGVVGHLSPQDEVLPAFFNLMNISVGQ